MEEAAKEIERLREEVRMPTPHEDALRMIDERDAEIERLRAVIRCEQIEPPADVTDDQTTELAVQLAYAKAEIARLRAMVGDEPLSELYAAQNERDEAREAARWLHSKLTDHLDIGEAIDTEIEAKKRWPWLEDGTDAERNET